MNDDADHVLLTLPRGDRGEIRLSRSRYQGRTFTKAQLWYPTEDGELKPGRQVVTIRDHELGEVAEVLSRIAAKLGPQEQPAPRQNTRGTRREKAPSGVQPGTQCSDDELREVDEAF